MIKENISRRLRARKKNKVETRVYQKPLDVLLDAPYIGRMTEEQRKNMTISCTDTDYIAKVKYAGKIKKVGGKNIQVLHNGLLVEADGYVGKWMSDIITKLKGHHEPQEEKAFYEVLKHVKAGGTMIELGSYWSYYSMWFHKDIKHATNICCEPDETNRKLGERNAELNGIKDIKFLEGAVGVNHGEKVEIVSDSNPDKKIQIPVLSVDGIVKENGLKKVDILHMDVQGFELEALKSAESTIKSGKLRFVFVSTHHYLFSKSPMTHADCIKFITDLGGHIIVSHTIPESFSGDGLIVASFDKNDKDISIHTSINHTDQWLFRTEEEDLQILIDYYGQVVAELEDKK